MKVQVKKLSDEAKLPTKGSKDAAALDLYARKNREDTYWHIKPHETVKVGTGLAFAPEHGYFGALFSRSGMAINEGLRLANCVGVCDEDYRGEYCAAIHNDSNEERTIAPGDRICQLIFLPYPDVELLEVDELPETARGTGGFGSTGK
jgi:dUTP pyrophosphatase